MLANGKTKVYEGTAEEAALAFLSEHRELFAMKEGLADLQPVKTTENRFGFRRVTFQQFYQDIPVEEALYKVHQYKDGRIGMANGFYYPDIDISPIPNISAEEAIEIGNNDLKASGLSAESNTVELVILPHRNGSFNLVWKIIVFSQNPLIDRLYYIDAHSGDILEIRNRLSDSAVTAEVDREVLISPLETDLKNTSESFHQKSRATGVGDVYFTSPRYSLLPDGRGVSIHRLDGGGNTYLKGTYADVLNEEQSRADEAALNFVYNTTDTHFDEVNIYYHIDKFRNYIENELGGLNLGFTQITAFAHSDNAISVSFSPISNYLSFGDGDGYPDINSTAQEDKIIYHEYTHAIIHDFNSGIFSSSNEEGAISEGVPDYIAGAYTGRHEILDWKYNSDPSKWRNMDDPGQYTGVNSYSAYQSNEPVSAHDGGEFFSAVLWDLRGKAGGDAEQIDFLVFDVINGLSSAPDFEEFLDVLVVADQAAYSGSHETLIRNTFAEWGIGNVPGFISSNTTWDGQIFLDENTNVDNTATLTILPGTKVYLEDDVSITIRPGAKLLAEGTQQEPIEFLRADPGAAWDRISLHSSAGNRIKWALFDGGYINLSIASKNNIIEHSTFRNATFRTMQGWHNQDGSGNAEANISYSLIENSASVGLVSHYLDLDLSYTTIKDNAQAGLYILSNTVYPFHHNLITGNGGTSRDGIEVKSSGILYMQNFGMIQGYNKVTSNGEDQISNHGDLVVGSWHHTYGGYNHIYGNYSGSRFLVENNSANPVDIYYNWWGPNINPAMFRGSINGSTYYLNLDPTIMENPGAGGQVPAKTAAEEPTLIDFVKLYQEAEEQLGKAQNKKQVRERFYRLYQLAGLSYDLVLKERFNAMAKTAASGLTNLYSSSEQNLLLKNIAKILHTKSLIRDEEYGIAQDYLREIDASGLKSSDQHDYLHLKMVTETYHGLYEEALATLENLYTFQESEGVDMEEFKAGYAPIEEDIKIRLKKGDDNLREQKPAFEPVSETNDFGLQAYPNPFNPTTNIRFTLPDKSHVSLVVYDMLGREVATLVNEILSAGEQTIRFDASHLSNGMYLYKLRNNNREIVKKMTLIK